MTTYQKRGPYEKGDLVEFADADQWSLGILVAHHDGKLIVRCLEPGDYRLLPLTRYQCRHRIVIDA
jgi:hypothetical protein